MAEQVSPTLLSPLETAIPTLHFLWITGIQKKKKNLQNSCIPTLSHPGVNKWFIVNNWWQIVSSRDWIKFKSELGPKCNHQNLKGFNSVHLSWKLSPSNQTKDVSVLELLKPSIQELAIQASHGQTTALLRNTLLSASEFTSKLSFPLLAPHNPSPPTLAELKQALAPRHALPLPSQGARNWKWNARLYADWF